MDEAEATQGDDAPESTAPAPQPEASPPVIDWSHLRGFQTVVEPGAETPERPETYAEELAKELATRAARFVQSVDDSIVLASDGVLRWLGDPVARVVGSEDLLRPRVVLLADDALSAEDRMAVDTRLSLWIAAHVRKVLGPLEALQEASELSESAREIARAIVQALGVLERERVRGQVKTLDQTARSGLRKLGVRFGSLYLYVPNLLKPAARSLCSQLWALRRGPEAGADLLLAYASAGRTSFANEGMLSPDTYRVAGFRLCGERVVRVDIIERLSDLIRAAIPDHMRAGSRSPSDAYGFLITPQMTSLTGCAGEAFASILRSLGFESHKVKRSEYETANRKAPTTPIQAHAPIADAAPPAGETSADIAAAEEEASRQTATDEDSSEPVSLDSDPESPPETMAELAPAVEPEATRAHEVEAAPSQPEAVKADVAESPAEPAEVEAATENPDGLEPSPPEAPESTTDSSALDAEYVEASSGPDAVETAAAPETVPVAEEEEVEIWRPAPRRPRPAPRPQRAPGEAREPGRFQGRRGESRRHGRDGEPAPVPLVASGETPPNGEAVSETPAEPRRHESRGGRPDRHRHDQPRQDQPRQDQPRHGDRPPRREEGRPQEPKRGGKEAPPRREPRPVAVDPDSPFAKLLALKPLLERRDKRP